MSHQPTNTRNTIVHFIRENSINSARLRHEPINIQNIANELVVSVTPVREALLQLVGEGLVDIRENKGFYVRAASMDAIYSHYQILRAIMGRRLETLQQIDTRCQETLLKINDTWDHEKLNGDENSQYVERIYLSMFNADRDHEQRRVVKLSLFHTRFIRSTSLSKDDHSAAAAGWMTEMVHHLLENRYIEAHKLYIKKMDFAEEMFRTTFKEVVFETYISN